MKNSVLIGLFAILLLFVGCDNSKRSAIVRSLEEMRQTLPMEVPNSPLVISDIYVEGDIVVYIATMPEALAEEIFITSETANSDESVARVINNIDRKSLKLFTDAGLGIKYIYKARDTGKIIMSIEADCNRLKRIMKGVDTGEINAIKALDLFRMEIEQLEFPVKFEDYFSMTNAYIRGKNVYYEYTFELEISASDFSDADILEMKKEIINGLIEANISAYKKDMAKEGVKLYTIYKNIKGEEIARIVITADDL